MGYSYADLKGDKPYVAPTAAAEVNKYVRPLAERKPDLVEKLRAVARQLGRERPGGITAADVWAALDAGTKAEAQAEGRIMGAVFSKSEWFQTGEWRRLGSHGRPQPVWVLKAARPALKVVGAE